MKNVNQLLARIYEIDNTVSDLERERDILRGQLIAEGKARLVTDEYEEAQVFTPPWATNQMIDMLDQNSLSDHETFFFEPTCGDGAMLVVIVDRIFNELFKKYGDKTQALADTLFKFYAIELDAELVPKARKRIYDWAVSKIERELSELEMYLVARSLQQSIENRDFFEAMNHPIDAPSGAKAISRKLRNKK